MPSRPVIDRADTSALTIASSVASTTAWNRGFIAELRSILI